MSWSYKMTDNFLALQAVCSVKSVVGKRIIICEVWSCWRDKIQNMMHAHGMMRWWLYWGDDYPVFLCIFGWIARDQEAFSRNYRHHVCKSMSCQPLGLITNFYLARHVHGPCMHHGLIRPGKGFTCQVNCRDLSWDRTAFACVAIKVHDHYIMMLSVLLPALAADDVNNVIR